MPKQTRKRKRIRSKVTEIKRSVAHAARVATGRQLSRLDRERAVRGFSTTSGTGVGDFSKTTRYYVQQGRMHKRETMEKKDAIPFRKTTKTRTSVFTPQGKLLSKSRTKKVIKPLSEKTTESSREKIFKKPGGFRAGIKSRSRRTQKNR